MNILRKIVSTSERKNLLNFSLIGITIFSLLIIMVFLYWRFVGWPINSDQYAPADTNVTAAWGQMGDFFGGMLNPILSAITVFLLLYSGRMQRTANRREELMQIIKQIEQEIELTLSAKVIIPIGICEAIKGHFVRSVVLESEQPLRNLISESKGFEWLDAIVQQGTHDELNVFLLQLGKAGFDFRELTHHLKKLKSLGNSNDTVGHFCRRHIFIARQLASSRAALGGVSEELRKKYMEFWLENVNISIFHDL